MVALFFSGVTDGVSMIIRNTILRVLSPERIRGRVASVNWVFIGASNELGAFESGFAARLFGTVPSVVGGGILTLAVVGAVGAGSCRPCGRSTSETGRADRGRHCGRQRPLPGSAPPSSGIRAPVIAAAASEQRNRIVARSPRASSTTRSSGWRGLPLVLLVDRLDRDEVDRDAVGARPPWRASGGGPPGRPSPRRTARTSPARSARRRSRPRRPGPSRARPSRARPPGRGERSTRRAGRASTATSSSVDLRQRRRRRRTRRRGGARMSIRPNASVAAPTAARAPSRSDRSPTAADPAAVGEPQLRGRPPRADRDRVPPRTTRSPASAKAAAAARPSAPVAPAMNTTRVGLARHRRTSAAVSSRPPGLVPADRRHPSGRPASPGAAPIARSHPAAGASPRPCAAATIGRA